MITVRGLCIAGHLHFSNRERERERDIYIYICGLYRALGPRRQVPRTNALIRRGSFGAQTLYSQPHRGHTSPLCRGAEGLCIVGDLVWALRRHPGRKSAGCWFPECAAEGFSLKDVEVRARGVELEMRQAGAKGGTRRALLVASFSAFLTAVHFNWSTPLQSILPPRPQFNTRQQTSITIEKQDAT